MKITKENYKDGRELVWRGEVTVPTCYYKLRRGDRAQLLRQGNPRKLVDKITGICVSCGRLAGNIWLAGGYYTTPHLK